MPSSPPTDDTGKTRFIPSLSQIRLAAKELPDPEIWPEEDYIVPLESSSSVYEVTFQRIKFRSRRNGTNYRWIYNGRMLVRHAEA